MGISGHILGERKLRALQRWSGIPFDRAYNRNGAGGARVVWHGICRHYWVDFREKRIELDPRPTHWHSCPLQIIDLDKALEVPPSEFVQLFTGSRVTGPSTIVTITRAEPEEEK